uniref:Uncharacterized protein n=1 Tax=Panagrolaimus sp. JU765 TaxID=591449 RepID=A0AC34RQ65_9BILA
MILDEAAVKSGYHLEVFILFDGSDIAVYLDNMTNYIGSVVDVENSPGYPMPNHIPGDYTHIYFYFYMNYTHVLTLQNVAQLCDYRYYPVKLFFIPAFENLTH